jgi:hypothetical protein
MTDGAKEGKGRLTVQIDGGKTGREDLHEKLDCGRTGCGTVCLLSCAGLTYKCYKSKIIVEEEMHAFDLPRDEPQ